MKSANPQFGLVLAGGGPKGAYQIGALKYLSEVGIQPHIIAGSSIGALNSAVLSTYRPFSYAVERLDELWSEISQLKPLKVNFMTMARYATGFFVPTLDSVIDLLSSWGILPESCALLDPLPLENLVRRTINPSEIRRGTELWVTAFPCVKVLGIELDTMLEFIRASTGAETHWLCAQDFKDDETIYNLILASAALPWIFPRRKVNGTSYIDGGLADNIPLKPLADRGCNNVIVIHLENGAVWDREQFPNQSIIEIRPQKTIDKSDVPLIGMVSTFLDFSPERIADLKQRGYEDAKYCMEPILETLACVRRNRESEERQKHSLNSLILSTEELLKDSPLF